MKYSINTIYSTTVFFLLLNCTQSFGQSVGIGIDLPNPNAALHVDASKGNQGVIITRLTDIEITTLSTSLGTIDQGLLVFNSSTNKFNVWNGTTWELVGYGDNLGDHIASTNVTLKDNWISNDGEKEGISVLDNGNVTIGVTATNATQVNGTLAVSSNTIIDGNTTSNEFTYSSPKTRVLSVPTAAWNLGSIKTAVMLGGNLNVTGLLSGPSFSNIMAPLSLPQNAVVTTAQCYIQNGSGDEVSLRLYEASNSSGSFTSIFGTSSPAVNGWVSVDFGGTSWIINNEKSNYFFFIEEKVPNANIVIRGCRILYNVNSPD